MRTINLKFLWMLIGLTLGLGVGVFFLHRYQAHRNADSLKLRATAAKTDKKIEHYIDYMTRYLGLVGDEDLPALRELAVTVDDSALNPGMKLLAFFKLEEALRKTGGTDNDLKRRLVRVGIELERITDSMEHLKTLLKEFPEDAELHLQHGQCLERLAQYRAASQAYYKSKQLQPVQLNAYARLATLLRQRGDELALAVLDAKNRKDVTPMVLADELMEEMIAHNPQSFEAYLRRAEYVRDFDQSPQAAERMSGDMKRANELSPNNPNVLVMMADIALGSAERELDAVIKNDELRQKIEDLRSTLETSLKDNPKHAGLYLSLCKLEVRLGRAKEAAAVAERGLEQLHNHIDLLWMASELAVESERLDDARALIIRINDVGGYIAITQYLHGRILVKERKWAQAVRYLEDSRPKFERAPQIVRQIDMLLGDCYDQLGNPDATMQAYRRVVQSDPFLGRARLGLASALLKSGRVEDSLSEYQNVMSAPGAAALVARLMIQRNLGLPRLQRNWAEVEYVLNQAEKLFPDAPEIPIYRAELLYQQQKPDEGLALLKEARQKKPKEPGYWITSMTMLQLMGEQAKAQELRDEADKVLGDVVELRLAKARDAVRDYQNRLRGLSQNSQQAAEIRQQSQQAQREAVAAMHDLEKGADQFTPEEQKFFWRGMSQFYSSLREAKEAYRAWNKLVALNGDDISVRFMQFELALRVGDEEHLDDVLSEIRQIEGRDGPLGAFAEASLLFQRLRKKPTTAPEMVPRIRALLTAAAGVRPQWAAIPRLHGLVESYAGSRETASSKLQTAVDLGERDPDVLRILVQLLYEDQRYAAADAVIRKLSSQSSGVLSDDLLRIGSRVSMQLKNVDQAMQLAEDAAATTRDPRDLIWLSQLRFGTGKKSEAESPLRDAVKIKPEDPDGWVALVTYLARTDRRAEAETIIDQARTKVPEGARELMLGHCYSAIKQHELAEKHYERAVAASPQNVRLLRVVADFFLRSSQAQKAEPYLLKILDPDTSASLDDRAWARRCRAIMLTSDVDAKSIQQAMQLLDDNIAETGASPIERLNKARLLSLRPTRRERRMAVQIFESPEVRGALSDSDYYRLAQLYEATDDWLKARPLLIRIAAANADSPLFAAHCANSMIQRKEYVDADVWVTSLEKTQPQGLLALSLRVRLLKGLGRTDEALELLKAALQLPRYQSGDETYEKVAQLLPQLRVAEAMALLTHLTESPEEPLAGILGQARERVVNGLVDSAASLMQQFLAQSQARGVIHALRMRALAALAEDLGDAATAERLYQQFVTNATVAEASLIMVPFYLRQGKPAGAFDVCLKSWSTCRAASAAVANMQFVRLGKPTEAQLQAIDREFQEAVKKNPSSSLFMSYADFRDYQGRYAEAVAIYQQLLKREPQNLLVLNNLAGMLAMMQSQPLEALGLINRAIEHMGPLSELLDTRAMVYIALQQGPKAITDLKAALEEHEDAVKYYHLALAHKLNNDSTSAKNAFERARKLGLTSASLHPLEQKTLEQMTRDFK